MVTHSCVLAWRIPWTEEPGGLRSMGHTEADTTEVTEHTHTHTCAESTAWVTTVDKSGQHKAGL